MALIDEESGLTEEELKVNKHLVEAWNAFNLLEQQHPCDKEEFCLHLHKLQHLIGMRVVRRSHPKYWYSDQSPHFKEKESES